MWHSLRNILEFPCRQDIFTAILATIMVPRPLTIVPLFIILRHLPHVLPAMASVPVIILFLVAQRNFTKGIALTGLKS